MSIEGLLAMWGFFWGVQGVRSLVGPSGKPQGTAQPRVLSPRRPHCHRHGPAPCHHHQPGAEPGRLAARVPSAGAREVGAAGKGVFQGHPEPEAVSQPALFCVISLLIQPGWKESKVVPAEGAFGFLQSVVVQLSMS